MAETAANAAADRPFGALAQGLEDVYKRLQPASSGAQPSAGDRLAGLGGATGAVADAARTLLKAIEDLLDWLDKALADLQPILEQIDAVIAVGGLLVTFVDSAVEAGAGLASAAKELVDQQPGDLLSSFKEHWPDLDGIYKTAESKAVIIPPPEDVAAARKALAPLLEAAPGAGARSLRSLRAGLGGAA